MVFICVAVKKPMFGLQHEKKKQQKVMDPPSGTEGPLSSRFLAETERLSAVFGRGRSGGLT